MSRQDQDRVWQVVGTMARGEWRSPSSVQQLAAAWVLPNADVWRITREAVEIALSKAIA